MLFFQIIAYIGLTIAALLTLAVFAFHGWSLKKILATTTGLTGQPGSDSFGSAFLLLAVFIALVSGGILLWLCEGCLLSDRIDWDFP